MAGDRRLNFVELKTEVFVTSATLCLQQNCLLDLDLNLHDLAQFIVSYIKNDVVFERQVLLQEQNHLL